MDANNKAQELQEALKVSNIGKNLQTAFEEQNLGLTLSDMSLYVYLVDTQGPAELEGIHKQYSIVKAITNYDFSKYMEIYDNVEAFLHKLLYVIDREKYDEQSHAHKGLCDLLKSLQIIEDAYFDYAHYGNLTPQKRNLYNIIRKIVGGRNTNSHNNPNPTMAEIEELVWKSLFIELWTIRKYEGELQAVKNGSLKGQYGQIAEAYLQSQISDYEKRQQQGLKYIQIEYENTQDPDASSQEDSFTVIKGTADNLFDTIHFEKTPAVKLIAEAGMGKTMMLEYLTYKLSRDTMENRDALENQNVTDDQGTTENQGATNITENQDIAGSADNRNVTDKKIFPIFICCNDTSGDLTEDYNFKSVILNKFKNFLDNNYENIMPEDLYKYVLENFQMMFLLDGLNEIRDSLFKSKFIKSLLKFIQGNKQCYFLITERYSRDATTITKDVVYYKLSKLTPNIKREFFMANGAETLFNRLDTIRENYTKEEQKELDIILERPFYLSIFCEMSDSFSANLPKDKLELMDHFVKQLLKRERDKGEVATDYAYIKLYLAKLAELSKNRNVPLLDASEEFANITNRYGLNMNEYSSNRILGLFEQFGFIKRSDDNISIADIYSDYMDGLLMELL